MLSPAANYVFFEFSEFWTDLKSARGAGSVHEWIVHRVREEWVPWWMKLAPERRDRIVGSLAVLTPEEREWLLHSLRVAVEADCEDSDEPPNGPGSGNWVFMQFAHVEPFDGDPLFADWRLDAVSGFRALCLHPDKSLPIFCTLLRRGREAMNYEYNVRLNNTAGVRNAIEAVGQLVKSRLLFFDGCPRGCAHQPWALRLLLILALIIGPSCAAAIYVLASAGHLDEALLGRLLWAAWLCTALFWGFWLIGFLSDLRDSQQLAAILEKNQVAWGFGDWLPVPGSRNSLHVEGESFGVALALSILRALANRLDTSNCWIVWWLRRAEPARGAFGITGGISPAAKVLNVDGFGDQHSGKKWISIQENRTMLAPVQPEAEPTEAELAAGLRVERYATLEQMLRATSGSSGVTAKRRAAFLWLGAAAAVLLILFCIFTYGLLFLTPPPELVLSHPPIMDGRTYRPEEPDRKRPPTQHLILHFRTRCAQCVLVEVHSTFWKTNGPHYLSEEKGSDIAVFEMELEPRDDATGNSMDSYVDIQRTRALPFLQLPPAPLEQVTFARLNDMYERAKGVGKYAYPNH